MGNFIPKRLKSKNLTLNKMYISAETDEDFEWMLKFINTRYMKQTFIRYAVERYNNINLN